MSRRRFALAGLGLGIAASQAGHLLAYILRYGAGAIQVQSGGAHAYFPATVKTGLGAAVAVALMSLLVIGFARMAAGRPIAREQAPSLLRLFAVLYTLQLACFVFQETAESAWTGAYSTSPAVLLLWGTAGQMPVALAAALALRWLAMRLGPAIAQLRLELTPLRRRFVYALTAPAAAPDRVLVLSDEQIASGFSRRGPPH
ncbi:MAG TPA: hypothetical protein VGE99_00055 [Candidatus Dormibacteraeota bacterium]